MKMVAEVRKRGCGRDCVGRGRACEGATGTWSIECEDVYETVGVLVGGVVYLAFAMYLCIVCECRLLHTAERRRSAALCMMKPCIGYDFCLSDIHIHAWRSLAGCMKQWL